jgi:DNA-binding transcriptional MocR family regulator
MTDHSRFLSTAARQFQESAIRKAGALAATVPDLISFSPGYPAHETFPWDELKGISAELLASREGDVLQYGATRGYRPLIEQVRQRLATMGITAAFEEVVITNGSQQGLDLAGRVLLDPGDVALVELPAYSGAIAAFQNLQATLVGVPQDAEGISIAGLNTAIEELASSGRRARFVYVTPNFQNPTGALMSPARRQQLLAAAAEHDLLIVEDDPYGSIYFEDVTSAADTRPIKADDADGRVVYLGTISKTLVPGLRVAWMIAPAAITERVELAKQATDLCTGVFDQRLVHVSLERGIVDALGPKLRAVYQRKRTVMEYAMREQLGGRARWASPRGGFFLWVDFGEGIDDRALFARAVANQVSFVMGSAFFVNGEGHRFARLSFSAPSHDRIREGVRRLARAVDAVSGSPGDPDSGKIQEQSGDRIEA